MIKRREGLVSGALVLALFLSLCLPSSFPFSHVKVVISLVSVFVMPGILALSFIDRRLRAGGDLFEKLTLALAISFALLFVPWVQVFILRLDLRIAAATVLGFDLVLVGGLLATGRHAPVEKPPDIKVPAARALLVFIAVFVALAYLYGGNVFGDGYSYTTWLRNIYVGDVSPQANVHSTWESAHPYFTNIFSPALMGYAICAKLARVDPNVVWSLAPAFLTFFFLAVNYSLTYLLFKKRIAAGIAILITPLVLGNNPSVLGDSHGITIFVLAPLAVYVALRYSLKPSGTQLDRLALG